MPLFLISSSGARAYPIACRLLQVKLRFLLLEPLESVRAILVFTALCVYHFLKNLYLRTIDGQDHLDRLVRLQTDNFCLYLHKCIYEDTNVNVPVFMYKSIYEGGGGRH